MTILSQEVWEELMAELGGDLDPIRRRANILVSGVALANSRGKTLRVGGVRVAIGGETRPCERMEEALPGLRAAMQRNWNGGVFGTLLDSGRIRVGDAAGWVAPG